MGVRSEVLGLTAAVLSGQLSGQRPAASKQGEWRLRVGSVALWAVVGSVALWAVWLRAVWTPHLFGEGDDGE